MNRTALKTLLISSAIALSGAQAHAADEPSPFKFDLHGFVGTSLYVQSNPNFFLNGQGAMLLKAQNNATVSGFDIRQTRLNFSVTGPTLNVLGTATPKAVIELDFFGLDGAGAYGEVNALNRLRLAYGELNWGNTWVHFGQDWQLLYVQSPTSIGHVAFPVTWFAGQINWREPGITVAHKVTMSETSDVEGALQILKSDWNSPNGFSQTNGSANQN
jgi:hypothetical protein